MSLNVGFTPASEKHTIILMALSWVPVISPGVIVGTSERVLHACYVDSLDWTGLGVHRVKRQEGATGF